MSQRGERERMPSQKQRSGCPSCGSPNVLRIVYGHPGKMSNERYEEARREGIAFGGCCPRDATRQCGDCGSKWGADLGREFITGDQAAY